MPSDFKHKEPSKTEKMMYEIVMNMNSMEKGLWSTSAHVVALGLVLGVDPEKIGELMVNGDEKMKEYSKKVNDAIQKLEMEKRATSGGQSEPETHNHAGHAGHDHGAPAAEEIEAPAEEKTQE